MEINGLTQSQNLTERARLVLNNLRTKTTHPAPCPCASCLYFEYIKGLKARGKPIGESIFFLAWLIHSVKLEYLRKTQMKKGMPSRLPLPIYLEEYKRAPYLKRTWKICDEIDPGWLDYSIICIYKSRTEKLNFLKLEEELIKRRNLEWLKSRPKEMKIWKRNWDDLKLAQQVADLINSKPDKKITQRELQRSLSSKKRRIRIKDFKRIQNYLEANFGIEIKPGKRSIIYRWLK